MGRNLENAKRFGEQLKGASRFVEDLAANWTTNIALKAHEVIQDRTPVDTGRAIGSWNLAQDNPNLRTLPVDFNRGRDPATVLQAPSLAQIDAMGHSLGGTFFVTNSVPYIIFLEMGSSRQAPNGMVTVGLAQLRLLLKSLDPRRQVRIG